MKHKTTCALAATGVITMGLSVWADYHVDSGRQECQCVLFHWQSLTSLFQMLWHVIQPNLSTSPKLRIFPNFSTNPPSPLTPPHPTPSTPRYLAVDLLRRHPIGGAPGGDQRNAHGGTHPFRGLRGGALPVQRCGVPGAEQGGRSFAPWGDVGGMGGPPVKGGDSTLGVFENVGIMFKWQFW